MFLKKGQLPIVITTLIALLIFTAIFLSRQNYEFIIYIGVIVFFFFLILLANQKINYPNIVLWGLAIWAILHMAGGGLFINGTRLYEIMLVQIVGAPYNIFKYDQFVHAFGFGVATFAMYYLIKPMIKENSDRWISLSIVIVMSGLGAGALNEIIEFFATVVMPKTGVGGYENTALDLVANLIGAIIAMILIYKSSKKKTVSNSNEQL